MTFFRLLSTRCYKTSETEKKMCLFREVLISHSQLRFRRFLLTT
eukprot:UN22053